MKYINKTMIVAINKLSAKYAGGTIASDTNIRDGQSLSFTEHIFYNSLFGEVLYPDIFHQAAAYMFYIIKNHIFMDGNKRTGLASAITFLKLNNIIFAAFDEDIVFDYVIDVAQGPNDTEKVIPEIASWLKSMCLY